jgi:hypothetical protein
MTSYATAVELRARLEKTATTDDAVLTALLAASSAAVDRFCNRPDGFVALATAVARTFAGSGHSVQAIDECAAITLVETGDGTTWTAWGADDWLAFRGDPAKPDFANLPYTGLMVAYRGAYATFPRLARNGVGLPSVRVTARWGYAETCPPQVREAAIVQAARWWQRGKGAWADTLGNADMGLLMYRKVLDPDVEHMLVSGRLVRLAVG